MGLNIGVIGAGAMGTAISQSIAENTEKIFLYARKKEICNEINKKRINSQYYPNLKLHKNIIAINDLEKLSEVNIIFLCVPSSTIRKIMNDLKNIISKECIIVSAAKGIENLSNKRMSEVIKETIGRPGIVLSGPNIASEMAKNLATATTIAGENLKELEIVKKALTTKKFKVNSNSDVIGTEFCGIIKNILAISQGIIKGLGINENAKFAVFTKSYNEIKDLIENFGGKRDTVDDYCGFGDIITASTLTVSRNHTLGVLYGQRIVIDEKASGILFEGKNTILIIKELCNKYKINSLTVDFTYDVIILKKNPKEAFDKLWDSL